MPSPTARRILLVLGCGALALLAIIATGLAPKLLAEQGAPDMGALPPPAPTWEQLMGRSVQARKAGATREAATLLEQAASLAATFSPTDMRRAHTRMGQAELHLWSGDTRLAELAYVEAVKIGETAGGASHPEMVSLLEGLGNFYYYRERYDEAAPVFLRLLTISRGAEPRDLHEEARRLRNLAQVHQLRRRYDESMPLYVEALQLVEASPSRTPAEVAEYLQALAECHRESGKARLAGPFALRAVRLVESFAGADTLAVVPYVKTLADVTLEAGEPARAAELYRRAIIIVERVSGAEHSDLAPFLVGLGNALRAQGKLREANTHVARARKVIEGV